MNTDIDSPKLDAVRDTAAPPRYPALVQIDARLRLADLARALGRAATLDDIDDAELDRLAALGFDWVWWLGVWHGGLAAQPVAPEQPGRRDEAVVGAHLAIVDYSVPPEFGGDAALARLRGRMRERGLKLMLDFVPDQVAPGHPWVEAHPGFFIEGSAEDLARAPQLWCRQPTAAGPRILAHGRDTRGAGRPDTLQLNHGKALLQQALIGELQRIAGQCDGLGCHLAMQVLPQVFQRTWGLRSEPFWPRAVAAVRHRHPGFEFLAMDGGDLEATLLQQGFDHVCEPRLYQRLCEGPAQAVREQLQAGPDLQERRVRFLEKHDTARAAAVFAPARHAAAALLTFATPGLRLFHRGQLGGPDEAVDEPAAAHYQHLLGALRRAVLRDGLWSLLDCTEAWPGNPSADAFIAWHWQLPGRPWLCAAVNQSPHAGQCYVQLPGMALAGRTWRFADLLTPAVYERAGDDLAARGLYLDLPAWGHHLFEVTPVMG